MCILLQCIQCLSQYTTIRVLWPRLIILTVLIWSINISLCRHTDLPALSPQYINTIQFYNTEKYSTQYRLPQVRKEIYYFCYVITVYACIHVYVHVCLELKIFYMPFILIYIIYHASYTVDIRGCVCCVVLCCVGAPPVFAN